MTPARAALLDALTCERCDVDEVDHAAEHYAMTGSPVCWCEP